MKRIFNAIMGLTFVTLGCQAQMSEFDNSRAGLEEFIREARADLEDFRRKNLEEFSNFLRDPWQEFEQVEPVPAPKKKVNPPVVVYEEEPEKPFVPKPLDIVVVKPAPLPLPQPQPMEPIKLVPVVQPIYTDFEFFGTPARVSFNTKMLPRVETLSKDVESDIADAFEFLSSREENDNLIVECLALRDKHQLSDWAYLHMLKAMATEVAGVDRPNAATLLMAYVYLNSGYKMRFATDGEKLYMLYTTHHLIYDLPSFVLDGKSYYSMDPDIPRRLRISQAAFPQEQPLSLIIGKTQKFAHNDAPERTVKSARYPNVQFSVTSNLNLMSFYNIYPASMVNNDQLTSWAIYANTPLDESIAQQILPTLREELADRTPNESVERLLNLVQKGFEYGYDDQIWGRDRTFFAEESLYYPFCDCEDRSVLFTRLVRDLLGLDCALVYYPGHLAAAVAMGDDFKGDYLEVDGRHFTICDPTYIGAPAGRTMKGMDNTQAQAILLQK